MGISKTFAVVAALSGVASATGGSARSAVATYWGQAGGSLRSYCETADTDYIPLGFINYFPEQGNGWPGSNYASSCWAETYTAPGYRGVNNPAHNRLFNHCPNMAQDIQYCQSKGKTMLLSLGGGPDTYSLTGKEDGEAFADFLWGAYGPYTNAWTGPRPFDPLPGTEGEGIATVVDGFDFDIEHPDTDKSVGYIAMINRLRKYFPKGSNYLITGAPQCVVNDANMDLMIQGAEFDIIWVQFYNTWGCSVRDWVTLNPNYAKTGVETTVPKTYPFGGFSYDAWLKRLQAPGSKSKNAKLAIGVLGQASTDLLIDFAVSSAQLKPLIDEYFCHDNFGGFMIWDSVSAGNNKDKNGKTFTAQIKSLLLAREAKGCGNPTSTVSSTTTKASTTTTSSSSTNAPVSTKEPVSSTSSSSTNAPVSTKEPVSSTSSSSTNAPVSTNEPVSTTTSSSTNAPVSTKEPVSTKSSSSTDAPVSTNEPVSTTSSSSTNAPVSTKEPVSTKSSSSTDAPVFTKEPVSTNEPVSTKASITAGPITTGPSTAVPTSSGPYGNSTIDYPTLTSTILRTTVYTVTSCAPTVTNCPLGHVTTATLTDYTTWCPGNPFITAVPTTTGAAKSTKSLVASIVYTTIVYTVTACPASVTNCPAHEKTTHVATQTKALYTTLCEEATTLREAVTTLPEKVTTLQTTTTSSITITLASKPVETTEYVYPTPAGTGGVKAVGTAGVILTQPQPPFTGGAGRVGTSMFAAAVVGVLALLM